MVVEGEGPRRSRLKANEDEGLLLLKGCEYWLDSRQPHPPCQRRRSNIIPVWVTTTVGELVRSGTALAHDGVAEWPWPSDEGYAERKPLSVTLYPTRS
jgi:hypothetical protein